MKSLLIAYGLIAIVLFISWHNKLTLEKEVFYGSLRATVQLVIMGFLLEMILTIDNFFYLALILLAMAGIAATISGKRGRKIPHAFGIAFTGILIGSVITFAVLAGAGVIGPEAKYIIPLGGMIIGNSMKRFLIIHEPADQRAGAPAQTHRDLAGTGCERAAGVGVGGKAVGAFRIDSRGRQHESDRPRAFTRHHDRLHQSPVALHWRR